MDGHIRYGASGVQRQRCRQTGGLTRQHGGRNHPQHIPAPSGSRRASATGHQVVKTITDQHAVGDFVQAVPSLKIADGADRRCLMAVAVLLRQRSIAVKPPGRAQLRHAGQHMNATRPAILLFLFFQHQKLILLQIGVDGFHCEARRGL